VVKAQLQGDTHACTCATTQLPHRPVEGPQAIDSVQSSAHRRSTAWGLLHKPLSRVSDAPCINSHHERVSRSGTDKRGLHVTGRRPSNCCPSAAGVANANHRLAHASIASGANSRWRMPPAPARAVSISTAVRSPRRGLRQPKLILRHSIQCRHEVFCETAAEHNAAKIAMTPTPGSVPHRHLVSRDTHGPPRTEKTCVAGLRCLQVHTVKSVGMENKFTVKSVCIENKFCWPADATLNIGKVCCFCTSRIHRGQRGFEHRVVGCSQRAPTLQFGLGHPLVYGWDLDTESVKIMYMGCPQPPCFTPRRRWLIWT
jgi:hypothetical protein